MTILLELSFIMDKRKQGIALFITLMVIASIMSIIAVSFTYLEKVQKDAGVVSAMIQGDLLHGNTVDILKRFFPKGKDNNEKLKIIYSMPLMLSEEKSGFSLNLTCQPLIKGVPISWLDEKSTTNVPEKTKLTQEVLDSIMVQYDIQEPEQLKETILEAITGKFVQNEEYIPRIKPKKGIVSKSQFSKMIIDYALDYDDPKVLNVPWDKYFSFTKITKKTTIDGMYLSAEFIAVAFEIPIEMVQDDWIPGETTLVSFLRDNAISEPVNKKIYSTKALNAMHCEQSYAYQDRQYKFNFDYIDGRSTNFEFNGQEQ
jgi:hypothetical protein